MGRPSPSQGSAPFQDIDTLRSADGLVAIISQRRVDGRLTMGIFKEFERDGTMERTSFIPEDVLGDSYEEIVKLARKRCEELRQAGNLPFPVRPQRRA